MKTTYVLLAAAITASSGCYDGGARSTGDESDLPTAGGPGDDQTEREPDDGPDSGEPEHHGEGDADAPAGRRVRRMTAAQFHASLVTVTGQPWPQYEAYAGAMGQADYAEITEEGRELSVTFDKFVHDAAMYSCNAAVEADAAGGSAGTILRWVTASDREDPKVRRNLDYLMLRFLGQEMAEDDPRIDPWMHLLMAEPEDREIDDGDMQGRWTAVCVGLVTHPDFVTY